MKRLLADRGTSAARRTRAWKTLKVGFTLIELLVVIAIIAILASMLLPSISKARGKALQIQCTSRQKQVYLYLTLYANDHDGYIPPAWNATTTRNWTRHLIETFGSAGHINQATDAEKLLYRCTKGKEDLDGTNPTYGMFFWNDEPRNEDPVYEPAADRHGRYRLDSLSAPDRPTQILFGDVLGVGGTYEMYFCTIKGGNHGPGLMHDGMANFINVDGSAERGDEDFFATEGWAFKYPAF